MPFKRYLYRKIFNDNNLRDDQLLDKLIKDKIKLSIQPMK